MPSFRRLHLFLGILLFLALAAGEPAARAARAARADQRRTLPIAPTVQQARSQDRSLEAGREAAPEDSSGLTEKTVVTGNAIDYHNGPILPGRVNVYFIWYGNWNGNTATTLLPLFVNDLNRTNYYNTNTTYGQMQIANDATGHVIDPYQNHVANSVGFGGQIFDPYSFGATLTRTGVQNVVNRALSSGLPVDGNGLYFVLTSADVSVTDAGGSSFCGTFCGYHFVVHLHGADIKYGFVGNPDRCPSACTSPFPQLGFGPNGNPGADGMINVLAHEIDESVTDPYLTGWFRGSTSGENGDLCAWNFGPGPFGPNPNAPFNVTFNGRHYLIQENYVNASGGFCGLGFATPSGTPANATLAVTGAIGCSGDGGCEAGQIQVQLTDGVTTVTETIPYDGFGLFGPADAQGVANSIASALNGDSHSPVTAVVTPQGPTVAPTADPDWWITLTTKGSGLAFNQKYVYTVAIQPFGGPFQNTTLAITPSPGTLSGGSDPCCSQ